MIINTDKQTLMVELINREQVWALKSKLTVLKKDIVKIEYCKQFNNWRKWEIRLPGAGIPGKLVAGSFWTEQGWDFLYIKNPKGWLNPLAKNVIYIETKLTKYKRIILSINQEKANEIIAWYNLSKRR